MKVGKDGKLKLSKDERQVENFVFKNEEDHIKICDINSQFSHRVSKTLNIGRMLSMAYDDNDQNFLSKYATMLWVFSNIIPDVPFVNELDRICIDCINRNKEFYGIKEDITSEDDNEILEEVKTLDELSEDAKKEE